MKTNTVKLENFRNQLGFNHKPLELIDPSFGSNLTNLIIELDFLRKRILRGTTQPKIFFQLKRLFHILESIASARIEGNNTTVAEYIETKILDNKIVSKDEEFKEIKNMEDALAYIDENIDSIKIDKSFISDLHKMVVKDLSPLKEGDKTPGIYREYPVSIKKSKHIPPNNSTLINQYMEELFVFINNYDASQYDLLKAAISHHRFVWIHPFGNGNGRTVRLFTYAILIKQGFRIDIGQRILNPTAVFCSNRDKYYDKLSLADTGEKNGVLDWCEYVLQGLRDEIEKVDKLLDYNYLKENILIPALNFSIERKFITEIESKILKIAIDKQEIQASDIKHLFVGKDASIISRNIKRLVEKRMLIPVEEKSRKYTLRFDNNYLARGVINALDVNSFLPDKQMKGDFSK